MKNKYKIGEIVITKRNFRWHDNRYNGCWHDIKIGDEFRLVEQSFYDTYVKIENCKEEYLVFLKKEQFYDSCCTKKELRKEKIKSIKWQIGGE